MRNVKKILARATASLFAALLLLSGSAAAAVGSEADGNVGYDANGLHRNARFDVEQNSKCPRWNVNGTYTIDFEYQGSHYVHDATITNQTQNGNYKISGGYPAGGPFTYAWNGTGKVNGNNVTNSVDYTVGAPGTHMDMTGTIASNGTMSGSWTDNLGGTRTGTWTTASGAATQATNSCRGEGDFTYTDANGDRYHVNVKYVNIKGNDAWFAGKVNRASQQAWVGNWLFAKVHDGGGNSGGDQIWGSFTDENTAKAGVANMTDPADGPFAITSGNLDVEQ